jgi:DNA-binding NarL/FixJ family response regulator
VAAGEQSPSDASGHGLPAWNDVIGRYAARPLVLLLDLVMPGVDGMAVLAALRHCRDRDRLRVLVLTTYGGQASVRRALALGANGYMLKDSTAEQLATAVRTVADGLTALSPDADTAQPGARTVLAVDEQPATGNDGARQSLTSREAEVFTLLGEGLSNRAIAHRLALSERTVKIHVSRVLAKLGVESRTQAALRAHNGLREDL